jgi:hypothetical protein
MVLSKDIRKMREQRKLINDGLVMIGKREKDRDVVEIFNEA